MGILLRVFIKLLILLATIFFGFLLILGEEKTIQVQGGNGSDRNSEGYHYPNQTLYALIFNGNPEEWVTLSPPIDDPHVVILSLTKNFDEERRDEIRRTWARTENTYIGNGTVRVLFLLGNNEEGMGCLLQEQKRHQDLLVVKTRDSYRGLVYKILMALRFISQKYPRAHVVKIDEDVILDINQLMGLLSNRSNASFILGYPFYDTPAIREENHTYFVPVSAYPPERLPWYQNGNFYIISNNSLKELIAAAPHVPIFEIEDAFITGVLRNKANQTISSLPYSGFYQPSYPLCTAEYYERLIAEDVFNKVLSPPSPGAEPAFCLIYLRNKKKGQFELAKIYWDSFWKSQHMAVYLP